MGETRVDLQHLLEDLRDAYSGALEETILTEIVANSLDSGATCLHLKADPASSTLTTVDDGSGMRRRDLVRYHDLASSTKARGHGIGLRADDMLTFQHTSIDLELETLWIMHGKHLTELRLEERLILPTQRPFEITFIQERRQRIVQLQLHRRAAIVHQPPAVESISTAPCGTGWGLRRLRRTE